MSRGNQARARGSEETLPVSQSDVSKAINESGKALVSVAEKVGTYLAQKKLTTSQIRAVFGTVKQMEISGFDARRFVLLKPKLAYAAARHKEVRPLRQVLEWAIDEVGESEQKFRTFVDFFEAILAYHRAAGGRT